MADTTPPSIVSVLPDTTSRVVRSSEISTTFSEAMDTDTLTAANLRVTRSGVAVPAAISYDDASHKATIRARLDLLASYSVTAEKGLQDRAGNGLPAARSWSFKTADGDWQGARRLDPANAASANPDIAIDGDGNAAAVWANSVGGGWYEIRTATYSAESGWGSGATLSLPGSYHAALPRVCFDATGNALAVWTQSDSIGTDVSVWSARYVKGQGWAQAVAVDNGPANATGVSLALDAAGNGFAVWAKSVGPGANGNTDIWAARFTPTGGWQAAVRLGSSANIGTYDQAQQPQVVVDASGNGHVLWTQRTSSNPVWFAQYLAGSGWQQAVSLGATQIGEPFAPRLAVSPSGQVMALWNTYVYAGGPYRFDLWWSVLATPGGGWSTPALLENDDAGDALNQVVTADSSGTFHAIWQQHASPYRSDVLHREYVPGSGWAAPETISEASGSYDQNRSPSLAADRNGNMMAVWTVYASGYGGVQQGTFARRYIGGEGWQPTSRLDQAQGGWAMATGLAVNSNGLLAATWMEPAPFSSAGPVWANLLK